MTEDRRLLERRREFGWGWTTEEVRLLIATYHDDEVIDHERLRAGLWRHSRVAIWKMAERLGITRRRSIWVIPWQAWGYDESGE